MKTYAQSVGKEPFDWENFLNSENISKEQWDYAKQISQSWKTCPCGNMSVLIKRESANAALRPSRPMDEILYILGNSEHFHSAIENENQDDALDYFKMMKIREKQLLREIEKELKEKEANLLNSLREIQTQIASL